MSKLSSLTELTMPTSGNVLIIGPHLGGKTTIIRDIISCFDAAAIERDIFAYEYEHGDKMFMDMLPLQHMLCEPMETSIGTLLTRAQKAVRPVLIIDDCIYGVAFHYRSTLALVTQRIKKLIVSMCYPFKLCLEFDWIVILPCDFTSYREQIYCQYLGDYIGRDDFFEMMEYIKRLNIAAVVNTKNCNIYMYDTAAFHRERRRACKTASLSSIKP